MGNRIDKQRNRPEAQSGEDIRDSKHAKGRERQKGPQAHPEGGHGPKTKRAIRQTLQSGTTETPRQTHANRSRERGKHRLLEDREQSDVREQQSEKTRRSQYLSENDMEREGYDVPNRRG